MQSPAPQARRGFRFALVVTLIFGLPLMLLLIMRARWYAFALLLAAVLALCLLRRTRLYQGPRSLLCWVLALSLAALTLPLGRPDARSSVVGTLLREGMRTVVHLPFTRHGEIFTDAATVLSAGPWRPSHAYYHARQPLPGNASLEWVKPAKARGDKIIYHLHGGAYLMGLLDVYRDFAIYLSQRTGGRDVALLDYRIAPEHTFPAALDDALAGWEALLAEGYAPEDILLFGDSAGGNLALSLTLSLRDAGKALPGGIICLSPWTDLTESGSSYTENLYLDPTGGLLPGQEKTSPAVPTVYAGSENLHNPLLSPAFASYEAFPPMLITVGGWEVLRSDGVTVHEKAVAAGVDATLVEGYGMFHVYPMLRDLLPESQAAWQAIDAFLNRCEI